jgi:hypothetical protein
MELHYPCPILVRGLILRSKSTVTYGSQVRGWVEINSAENAIRIRGSLVTMRTLPVRWTRHLGPGTQDEKERISVVK